MINNKRIKNINMLLHESIQHKTQITITMCRRKKQPTNERTNVSHFISNNIPFKRCSTQPVEVVSLPASQPTKPTILWPCQLKVAKSIYLPFICISFYVCMCIRGFKWNCLFVERLSGICNVKMTGKIIVGYLVILLLCRFFVEKNKQNKNNTL